MVVLASASPRRRELMSLVCDSFIIEPADIDESVDKYVCEEEIPETLALKKASFIRENGHEKDTVIGCDTGVFLDGKMIGKPRDEQDAFEILKSLSGRTHKVITGCAILSPERTASFSQVTEVDFYPLTDDEIKDYIASGEPMDKAGAYGIQGRGARFVRRIEGDYFNVVGLPVARLYRELRL